MTESKRQQLEEDEEDEDEECYNMALATPDHVDLKEFHKACENEDVEQLNKWREDGKKLLYIEDTIYGIVDENVNVLRILLSWGKPLLKKFVDIGICNGFNNTVRVSMEMGAEVDSDFVLDRIYENDLELAKLMSQTNVEYLNSAGEGVIFFARSIEMMAIILEKIKNPHRRNRHGKTAQDYLMIRKAYAHTTDVDRKFYQTQYDMIEMAKVKTLIFSLLKNMAVSKKKQIGKMPNDLVRIVFKFLI